MRRDWLYDIALPIFILVHIFWGLFKDAPIDRIDHYATALVGIGLIVLHKVDGKNG